MLILYEHKINRRICSSLDIMHAYIYPDHRSPLYSGALIDAIRLIVDLSKETETKTGNLAYILYMK